MVLGLVQHPIVKKINKLLLELQKKNKISIELFLMENIVQQTLKLKLNNINNMIICFKII